MRIPRMNNGNFGAKQTLNAALTNVLEKEDSPPPPEVTSAGIDIGTADSVGDGIAHRRRYSEAGAHAIAVDGGSGTPTVEIHMR